MSFAPISSVDVFVTDTEISEADRGDLAAHGVDVVLASRVQS